MLGELDGEAVVGAFVHAGKVALDDEAGLQLQAAHLGESERVEVLVRVVAVGARATPMPAPGVYARHNAVDTPGLLPDGSPAQETVPKPLLATGVERTFRTADGRVVAPLNPTAAPDNGPENAADEAPGGDA